MKTRLFLSFLICLIGFLSYGQIKFEFSDKNEYLNFIFEDYALDRNNIYYISDYLEESIMNYPSLLFFYKNGLLVTIEKIENDLGLNCPPRKLLKSLSLDLVLKKLNEVNQKKNLYLINLKSGEYLESTDRPLAIFLFSKNFNKAGMLYIKNIDKLNKMGFKTIIVSMDMPKIEFIENYSKINQFNFKQQ